MTRARPSMQQLIRERRRHGFVGRGAERAAFRENFDLPPEHERHRFRFHVHGNAGVGKTFLVRELEQVARERGALTAYVDEAVGSVPEAMAALSAQAARQGHRFKELDRLLATHRERRHEAESAAVATLEPEHEHDPEPAMRSGPSGSSGPSAGSMTVARAGLVGLGMVPVVGPFAGALDPAQLAHGTDRLRERLSARLRNPEDVQLVLSPERVLTPVLLKELSEAAVDVPWIVLFFDTYERTGPFLDGWLHEVMTTDRHGGSLPANTVVVTSGQRPLDAARWGGFADFVRDVPLEPFTEAEARELLADRGVVSEPVVDEVLRLTGGLPVLVSTLAQARPADPDDVGDPSATAVERFLKWEQDPVRRAVALACALPRRLDADVFRAAVECPEEEAEGLFAWLRGLPFVSDRGDRLQYHDVVRVPMLRLQRLRSPLGWAERHGRLAETFGAWRAEAEAGLDADELWAEERWRELRLAESYHLLCAGPRAALPVVLRDAVDACGEGEVVARRWAQALAQAGEDADAEAVGVWGSELLEALARGGTLEALGLLLARGGFDARGQAVVCWRRGLELANEGENARAVGEFDRAVALDPELAAAYHGRAVARSHTGDYAAAITDLDRVDELAPGRARTLMVRGEYHRVMGNHHAALGDLDRAIDIDPAMKDAWAARGVTRHRLGHLGKAIADLDRALELDPEFVWALVRRARVWRSRHREAERMADLDRAVALAPDSEWVLCERGDALSGRGRHEEALADYDRAIELDGEYASAYASRGACRRKLGRHREALVDLYRAVDLEPEYAWALCQRAIVHLELDAPEQALADTDRARRMRPDDAWILAWRGKALAALDRLDEARTGLDRALELNPDYATAHLTRGTVLARLGRHLEAYEDLNRCFELLRSHPSDRVDLHRTAEAIERVLDLPGADRARLAPLLAEVVAVRDGARAEGAE
ncbi:tetratricopeptide repeat protein [Streptomyces sp. HC44]|uniref:Tetratricopeptide repeat protein n=1 Tax=Streptomyces scabichelini TaxID=2711217 RepID=A0A6G4UZE3_9ACTN|nr:tetratricopeptide repeat protein [Streptomyces scabichelini]NGO07045.1 tetratricopeptide repeat protein [Streptomyces scabichelini]